jgi:copper chaperone CopZ
MKIKFALRIDGMMCQKSCGSTVRNALLQALAARSKRINRSEGGFSAAKVEVSYEHRSTIIEVDEEEELNPSAQQECIDAVNDIGFGAELMANCTPDMVFQVGGMMCQKNCGGTVFNCAMAIHGVAWAEASFADKSLKVWGSSLDAHEIIENMDCVGFTASLLESRGRSEVCEEIDDGNDNDLMEIVVSQKGDVVTSDLETKSEITLYIANHVSDVNTKILEKNLFALHGVQNVQINKLQKSVKIWGNCDVELIVKTSADVGVELSSQKNTPLKKSKKGNHTPSKVSSSSLQQPSKASSCKVLEVFIDGLSVSTAYSSCEASLKTLPGVRSVNANALLSDKLVITFDEEFCSSDLLLENISSYGFEPEVTSFVSFGQGSTKTVVLKVGGMSCANCSIKIEKYIKSQIGVLSADVSCMTDKAKVVLIDGSDESAAVGIRSLIEGVESLGYSCSLHGIDTMKNDVEDEDSELNLWWRLLLFACALGIPVTVLHLSMLGSKTLMNLFGQPYLCSGGVTLGQTIMFCLNVPLQVIVGYRFYRGAYMGAKHGNFGMDALVVTGTSVTFTYSIFQLGMACHAGCPTRHIFLEASGMLLMFVTIGKYLEAYAKGKTYSAITSLLKLQPNEALLVIQNESNKLQNNNGKSTSKGKNHVANAVAGNEATKLIQLELVQKGDILKVLPGSRIPTDGRVVYGSSFVDESVITGESIPALRSMGDRVFGSTINQNSLMFIEVTSTGSESALSQIVKLVEEAQMNKAPVQAYADRIAASFTPFVIALSICTFAVWSCLSAVFHVVPKSWFADDYGDPWLFSMLFAISVVVISCPCALGNIWIYT